MLTDTSGDPCPDLGYSQSWLLLQKRWKRGCSCDFTEAQAIGRTCAYALIAASSVCLRVHSMVIILVVLNVGVTGSNATDHTCALLNPFRDVSMNSSVVVGAVRFTQLTRRASLARDRALLVAREAQDPGIWKPAFEGACVPYILLVRVYSTRQAAARRKIQLYEYVLLHSSELSAQRSWSRLESKATQVT